MGGAGAEAGGAELQELRILQAGNRVSMAGHTHQHGQETIQLIRQPDQKGDRAGGRTYRKKYIHIARVAVP